MYSLVAIKIYNGIYVSTHLNFYTRYTKSKNENNKKEIILILMKMLRQTYRETKWNTMYILWLTIRPLNGVRTRLQVLYYKFSLVYYNKLSYFH